MRMFSSDLVVIGWIVKYCRQRLEGVVDSIAWVISHEHESVYKY